MTLGSDGHVAVPPRMVGSRPPTDLSRWVLADGSIMAPLHRGMLQIGGFAASAVTVLAIGDEPILGRGVTDRFTLILDHGQQVRLQP